MTIEDVINILKKRQGDRSQHDFAEELGVSASYLSEIYRGTRQPGGTICEALGLEKEVVFNNRRRA